MPSCSSTAISPKAKVVWVGDHYSIFQKDCIYLLLKEGEGRRRSRREMLMCHRNINRLPLTCPQPGTWPATQARALTRNWTSYPFALWNQCPTHWAMLVRARPLFFMLSYGLGSLTGERKHSCVYNPHPYSHTKSRKEIPGSFYPHEKAWRVKFYVICS